MAVSKGKFSKDAKDAYILVLPFFIFFAVFILIPVFNILRYSFTKYDLFGDPVFVGLHNFRFMLNDPVFLQSLRNTIVYTTFTVIPVLILGFIIANLLNNRSIGAKRTLRVLFYMPYVPSMVSMAVVWMWVYDPITGIFNHLLTAINLTPQSWLSDPDLALPSIIAVSIWQQIGYAMVIYLAGLQMVPYSMYEAADIEGAGPLRKIVSITIPMVKETTFFLVVVLIIRSFNVFGQVNVMTSGGPLNRTTTIIHQVYLRAFSDFRFGYASSMSFIVLLIVGLITILNFKYGRTAHEREQ